MAHTVSGATREQCLTVTQTKRTHHALLDEFEAHEAVPGLDLVTAARQEHAVRQHGHGGHTLLHNVSSKDNDNYHTLLHNVNDKDNDNSDSMVVEPTFSQRQ